VPVSQKASLTGTYKYGIFVMKVVYLVYCIYHFHNKYHIYAKKASGLKTSDRMRKK
jgi:hypothetical protein